MGNCCKKKEDRNITQKDLREKLHSVNSSLQGQKKSTKDDDLWTTTVNFDDFNILMLLGKGSFGKVVLAKKKDNHKLYALKILNKSKVKLQNQVAHTKTERAILEKIDHPFIVKLKYAFQTPDKLCFVTEYMPGGELFYHLRKERYFSEDKTRFYISEIILGIEYLHKNNCIYRDLKPENILLDKNGHIRLTDFGLSKLTISKNEEGVAYTICGTPEYLAPEILETKGYTKSVDWWSLGALLYEMLVGWSPFKPRSKDKRIDIRLYKMPIDYKGYMSKEAISLIKGLLTIDPNERLGAGKNDSDSIKSHPFFAKVDWNDVLNMKIKPPFVPKITSDEDYSNFDKMFTEENPMKETPNKNSILEHSKFPNFTYDKHDFSIGGDNTITHENRELEGKEMNIKDIHIIPEVEEQ
jgi:serine/threonine protein kinase